MCRKAATDFEKKTRRGDRLIGRQARVDPGQYTIVKEEDLQPSAFGISAVCAFRSLGLVNGKIEAQMIVCD
jgi:hypothetical protein